MSGAWGSGRIQRQDLEEGTQENQQGDAILNACEEIDEESWKSIRWSLLLLLNLVAISLDPLFFYIPMISDELKCLKSDRNLGITAISLRFCVDILQLILWLHCKEEQLLKKVSPFLPRTCWQSNRQSSDSTAGTDEIERSMSFSETTSQRHKNTACLFQFVSILPLPQVATIIILTMEGSTKSPHAVTLLKFCVLSQFVVRAIRIYPSYKDATRKSTILLRGHYWVGAAFNLLLFVIVGHVLGAFWYLLSVGRNMDCWKKACESNGCDVATLYCIGSSGDKTYLNQTCPIETSDNPPFDFGIYLPALQSNIGSSSDFSLKLVYCFWWGLRNLSSLAQNLTTSAYQWETCFAISISIFGLILFSLLIGNMQTYLQCLTNKDIKEMQGRIEKVKEMKEWRDKVRGDKVKEMKESRDKVKEIQNNLIKWKPFGQLPEDLRVQAIWCEDAKWLLNKDIDLKSVLNTIAPELAVQIKEKLCLPLLSKVPLFRELDCRPLKVLCDLAKPEIFTKNSYIVRADSQIQQVILIVCGEVCSYKKEHGDRGVSPQKLLVEYLGDEVLKLNLSSGTLSLSEFPVAREHIKAVTKVEALVLTVGVLREVWSKFEGCLYESDMEKWALLTFGKWVKQRRLMKGIKKLSQDKTAE